MASRIADRGEGNNAINVADNYISDLKASIAPRLSGFGEGLQRYA
jgi:hypothetical protein